MRGWTTPVNRHAIRDAVLFRHLHHAARLQLPVRSLHGHASIICLIRRNSACAIYRRAFCFCMSCQNSFQYCRLGPSPVLKTDTFPSPLTCMIMMEMAPQQHVRGLELCKAKCSMQNTNLAMWDCVQNLPSQVLARVITESCYWVFEML